MGFKESIRACAKRSTHHFIGLGFWQAWQMVMLCTSAIIPDGGEGTRLKSIVLFATTAGYLVVIAAYKIRPSLSSSPRALLGAGAAMAAGTFLMLFVAFISDAGLKFVALAFALALMSWGNAALLIMWGELWETLATGRVGQHLYLSYAFAFVLFFIAIALPPSNWRALRMSVPARLMPHLEIMCKRATTSSHLGTASPRRCAF